MGDNDIRCPICNMNLRFLTERKREEHCDACLDNVAFAEPKPDAEEVVEQENVAGIKEEEEEDEEDEEESLFIEDSSVVEIKSENIRNAIGDTLGDSLGDSIGDSIVDSIGDSVGDRCKELVDGTPDTPESIQEPERSTQKSEWFFNLGKRERKDEIPNDDQEQAEPVAAPLAKRTKSERSIPFYKTLKLGQSCIAVDAFKYGSIANVSSYFLTHFHADHYGGLSKSWSHGPIYCSPATARLSQLKLRVRPEFIKPLDLNKEYEIDGVSVVLLDANHCPGAVVFLFNRTILHTGDFRATEHLVKELKLWTHQLNTVYLDTTYLDPVRKFPSQESVVEICAEYCASFQAKPMKKGFFTRTPEKRRILAVVGTYTIGKERLALAIARRLNNKIWAQPWKQKVLEAIEDPELNAPLDDDGTDAQVHLVSMGELSIPKLEQKWKFLKKHFTHLIAFIPTGWTWPKTESVFNLQSLENPKNTTVANGGSIRLCRVPYSEHSSYSELERFCLSVACKNLIATVHTKRYDILRDWESSKPHQ